MKYLSECVWNQLYIHNLHGITRVPSFEVDCELLCLLQMLRMTVNPVKQNSYLTYIIYTVTYTEYVHSL